MARTLEQKLATLAGLQKEIGKRLKDLEDNDLHFIMHRTQEELNQLLLEIDKLNKMANRLAHAVALLSDEDSSPLWVEETYRQWATHHKRKWMGNEQG